MADDFEQSVKRYRRHPLMSAEKICETVRDLAKREIAALDATRAKHPDYWNEDPVQEALTLLFSNDRVGDPDKPPNVVESAKQRFNEQRPPGFMDKDKDGDRKYGDGVLWLQALEYAKESKRPLILITDETKEDWWLKVGGKTFGALPELVAEMRKYARVKFHLYQPDQFLQYAAKFLQQAVPEKAVQAVRRIRARDEAEAAMIQQQFALEVATLHEQLQMIRAEREHLRTDFLRAEADLRACLAAGASAATMADEPARRRAADAARAELETVRMRLARAEAMRDEIDRTIQERQGRLVELSVFRARAFGNASETSADPSGERKPQ
jgi:hypothetical protein